MSDKPYARLHSIDKTIRTLRGLAGWGMADGTPVVVKLVYGFELFNTRPYHNYENWSDGYLVEVYRPDDSAIPWAASRAEDLDTALEIALKVCNEKAAIAKATGNNSE